MTKARYAVAALAGLVLAGEATLLRQPAAEVGVNASTGIMSAPVVALPAALQPAQDLVQQTIEFMWGGLDQPNERMAMVPEQVSTTPALQNVQLFGLQNSGVFLLRTLLYKNFGNQLNYYNEMPEDGSTNSHQGFWSHSNIKDKWRLEREVFQHMENDNVYAIIMIRNPLSWLRAMKKFPQEFAACTADEEWISSSCMHDRPGGSGSAVPSTAYANLASMWNTFNSGFHNAAEFGFPNRVVIPYESLLRNPQAVLDHIAAFLGMAKPEAGWAVPADAPGSETSGRSGALRYTYRKMYIDEFTTTDKNKACSHLDKELEQKYGYDDCSTALHIFTHIDGAGDSV